MEIGLQSVANGSFQKSFQKQNDFIVVENHTKMSHFYNFYLIFHNLTSKITKIAWK